jgi:hypothetical protein
MSDPMNVSPALESKIMKLHSRLEETVAQGRRRQMITTLVMGGVLLGAAAYLRYLYSTVAEFAEASTLVELAAAQVEPQLNLEASRFGTTLESQLPLVLDQAEKVVLAAPPQLAQQAEAYASTFVDQHLLSLENQSYDVVTKTLQGAIDKAQDQGIDLTDEKQFDALVDSAAPTMRETLKEAIDKLYAEYTAGAASVGGYIEELTTPGNESQLTPLQQSQRELLLTGLAIIKQIEGDPKRAPLQSLLEGKPCRRHAVASEAGAWRLAAGFDSGRVLWSESRKDRLRDRHHPEEQA